MATVKVTSTTGIDMDKFTVPDLGGTTVFTTHTPTKWHLTYTAGASDEYTGKNLKYDGGFHLTSGTITGFTIVESKNEKFQVSGVSFDASVMIGATKGSDILSEALKGDDTITGGNGNDHLLGFDGNDTIDGGKGNDTMAGGKDDDTYVVNSAADVVVENNSEGSDTVKASIAIAAVSHVENYTFTGKTDWTFDASALDGSDAQNNVLTGGAGKDKLTGGAGDDRLDGGKGVNTFDGGTGDDTYVIDNLAELANITDGGGGNTLVSSVLFTGTDITANNLQFTFENYTYTGKSNWEIDVGFDDQFFTVTGGAGSDKLTGANFGGDTLIGNAGNDILDGKAGADQMEGGAGNDTYVVDDIGDRVVEDDLKGGTDTVQSALAIDLLNGAQYTAQLIENATLTGTDDVSIVGNALKNVLTGNTGDNDIDGGANNDAMAGGGGSDTYHLDSAGDKVTELVGAGDHDKIISSVALKALVANVEDYTYTGAANWTFTGNKTDNTIHGGTGNDTLSGGGGKDTLDGGDGNDTYLVDSADDSAKDSGTGIDTVKTSFAIADATNFTGVENFTFTGKGDWSFASNTLDNTIIGGTGNDQLDGGAGNDRLDGGKGIDALTGGGGNDTYIIDNFAEIAKISETDATKGDTLESSVLFTDSDLGALASKIENFFFTGKGNWSFTANAADNAIGGGAGNDKLEGGDGDDTAVFHGKRTDYQLSIGMDGVVTVKDVNGATNGADGVDTLSHFEHLKFSDGTIDLDNTVLLSARSQAFAGASVAGIGDVNGDGLADFIVGAPSDDGDASGSGTAYIVYGNAAGLPDAIDLAALGSAGVKLSGVTAGGGAGYSVHAAGDVNGDGINDVIVSAPFEDGKTTGGGAAYVVFGGASLGSNIDLGTLNGIDGFILSGSVADGHVGNAVAAGDINGDGFSDLVVGAYYVGLSYPALGPGTTYVVFGHGGSFGSEIDLGALDGTNGTVLVGKTGTDIFHPGDLSGYAVSSAGDVNGDGIDDLVIGAITADGFSGATYVVFGHNGGFASPISLGDLDGTDGFKIKGAKKFDDAGNAVATGGDFNGDGYDDLVVGAAYSSTKGKYSGTAYVIFGHDDPFADALSLSSLNGKNGFKISGLGKYDYAGASVSFAGDVNGDGIDDIIIGAPGNPLYNTHGAAYLLFGHTGGFSASLDLSKLTLAQGIEFHDLDTSHGFGASVSGTGDINGDGYDDLLVGIPGADSKGAGEISTVVIYGGDFNLAGANLIQGTSGGDDKVGTAGADIINGQQGNDDLAGGGGKDVIEGGSGNDFITVSDHTFNHVDGGGGIDTLTLLYGGAIDFGNLDGVDATSDRGKITGVEVISAANGQANAMTLHLADVLDIAPQDQNVGGKAALDNVLTINGDAADSLTLDGADGWGSKDTSTLAGFALYTSHGVTIAVDTDITVTVTPP